MTNIIHMMAAGMPASVLKYEKLENSMRQKRQVEQQM